MSSSVLCVFILLTCAWTLGAAQTSCKGRCGAEYYRGSTCQCDYNCLLYGECCKDYESQCTTKDSCKGRCGETFRRGRICSCDSDCMKFKQCCSDSKTHCDAEVITTTEISGTSCDTAAVESNTYHNVNDNHPKDPPLNETPEQSSTFSEGNNADEDLIPLVSPTSYPQDEDEVNGAEYLKSSPVPESSSGYGWPTADQLDQISTESTNQPDTLEFTTETFSPDKETTQADDRPSSLPPTHEGSPAESTDDDDLTSSSDSGTTPPKPTSAADPVSSQPTPTSVNPGEISPSANIPEADTEKNAEDDSLSTVQNTNPSAAPSDVPKVMTTASYPPSVSIEPTLSSSTVLESSHGISTTASSTLDSKTIPPATTFNPAPEMREDDATTGLPLPDVTHPSTSVSSEGSKDLSEALTTPIADTDLVIVDTADVVTPGLTPADPLHLNPDPTKPTSSKATSKPQETPEPLKPTPARPTVAKPSSKPESKPLASAGALDIDNRKDYQADDNNDTNLCSGRPVSAVTTLNNGTVVVFRGHFFWLLDRNRVPGPALSITQVWGVPSPIDTVFTRCQCQGKTYIFKGAQYWRFENSVLDTGYPKPIVTGFDGLRGHITAALSVPQYKRRQESVYFFKRGGLVQKYSYQFGTSPTCGRKVNYGIYTILNRRVRQTVSVLGPVINIRTSWKGFPSSVTAAVSIPTSREPEGYKYYVFSKSKPYNVRMDAARPVIEAPTANVPTQSNVFKCPKSV